MYAPAASMTTPREQVVRLRQAVLKWAFEGRLVTTSN